MPSNDVVRNLRRRIGLAVLPSDDRARELCAIKLQDLEKSYRYQSARFDEQAGENAELYELLNMSGTSLHEALEEIDKLLEERTLVRSELEIARSREERAIACAVALEQENNRLKGLSA